MSSLGVPVMAKKIFIATEKKIGGTFWRCRCLQPEGKNVN